jgi:hypothetical protein
VGLQIGTSAPEFSAPLLDDAGTLNRSALEGHPTILLFVSPIEASFSSYRGLSAAIHAFWHRVAGRVYLVCRGNQQECRQFAVVHDVPRFARHHVQIALDSQGEIANNFQVDSTPVAVELDEDATVKRYGRPVIRPQTVDGGNQTER